MGINEYEGTEPHATHRHIFDYIRLHVSVLPELLQALQKTMQSY